MLCDPGGVRAIAELVAIFIIIRRRRSHTSSTKVSSARDWRRLKVAVHLGPVVTERGVLPAQSRSLEQAPHTTTILPVTAHGADSERDEEQRRSGKHCGRLGACEGKREDDWALSRRIRRNGRRRRRRRWLGRNRS
eukprot:scaffold211631_cov26-Tisochrysis_lutea.AAC.1